MRGAIVNIRDIARENIRICELCTDRCGGSVDAEHTVNRKFCDLHFEFFWSQAFGISDLEV
ncbi:hypothetical protein D3C86_1736650 [compost metagenome]